MYYIKVTNNGKVKEHSNITKKLTLSILSKITKISQNQLRKEMKGHKYTNFSKDGITINVHKL
jgi:hypothetical protein